MPPKTNAIVRRLGDISPRAFRFCAAVLALCTIALAILLVAIGPVVQNAFGHDTPLLLDGAWKILCGQKPYRDWYSPFGAFNFLLIAGAMRFTGATAHALPVAQAIVLLIVVFVAWQFAWPRFSAILAALYAAFAGIVAVSPHFLRLDYDATTYATLYNRWGYGFLLALMVALFLPPRVQATPRRQRAEAFAIGVIVVLLFFIKVTFCMAALVLLGGASLTGQPLSRKFWIWFLTGSAAMLLVFGFFIGFAYLQMVGDLRIAAGARASGLTPELVQALGALVLPVVAALAVCVVALATWNATPLLSRRRALVFWMTTSVVSVFLLATNAQDANGLESPLLTAAAFFYGFWIVETPLAVKIASGETVPRVWLFIGGLAMSCLIATPLLRDISSFVYAAADKKLERSEPSLRFDSPSLAPLVVREYGGRGPIPLTFVERFAPYFPVKATRLTKPPLYVEKINDGLHLLRVNCAPDTTVQALDFTNPFPFALGWKPAVGCPISWHAGFSLSEHSFPDADRVFAGSAALMVPKYPEDPNTTQLLLDTYYAYIRTRFHLKAQSDNWFLLVRNQPFRL